MWDSKFDLYFSYEESPASIFTRPAICLLTNRCPGIKKKWEKYKNLHSWNVLCHGDNL